MEKKPLAITLRVPLCKARCGYCDRAVTCQPSGELMDSYVHALASEIDSCAGEMEGYEVQTIRICGGTPTLLGGEALAGLLGHVRANFAIADDCEVTLGTAAHSLDASFLEALLPLGLSRVELEAGTLDPAGHLKLRDATPTGTVKDALAAISAVAGAGTLIAGIELLMGIPGQTTASICADIESAHALGAAHVHLEPLRLAPGTPVAESHAGTHAGAHRNTPDEDALLRIYQAATSKLAELGYGRYGVWDYALTGAEAMWTYQRMADMDELAFGAGAFSHYDGMVCLNTADITAYIEHCDDYQQILEDAAALEDDQEAARALAHGLACAEGIDAGAFNALMQMAPVKVMAFLVDAMDEGLIVMDGTPGDAAGDTPQGVANAGNCEDGEPVRGGGEAHGDEDAEVTVRLSDRGAVRYGQIRDHILDLAMGGDE